MYKSKIKTSLSRLRQVVNSKDYIFSIDSPKNKEQANRNITIEGWLIAKKSKITPRVRLLDPKEQAIDVESGLTRLDVASRYHYGGAEKSGFNANIEFIDGQYELQADFGRGFKTISKIDLILSSSLSVSDRVNHNLPMNLLKHRELLAAKKQYYYEPKHPGHINLTDDDPRLVAFYLPQFHPIKQNNEVWGEGFTEWTNVTSAIPRFIGHQQPILPSDLGFYDLRNEDTIKKQIDLAKKYGIYGFCFYYYWFSGEKILDKPLDIFLAKKEWNFNFTICWANENWTKRWDGRDGEIIIAQKYREEDPLEFIKDVEHILNDPRYITEDGKPVLIVYRASELKDPKKYAKIWRKYFKDRYDKELQLVSVLSFDDKDPREYGFDKALDFAPLSAFFKNDIFKENHIPYLDQTENLLEQDFEGMVADYREVVNNPKLYKTFIFPTYKSVMPSWDNDARKKGKGFVYFNANPDIYSSWLDSVISIEKDESANPLIFVNAWNEWAEGTVLEPSQHLGHSALVRTAEIVAKHSKSARNSQNFPLYGVNKQSNLAVVVHLFYPELWPKISAKLRLIDEKSYDLFVTICVDDSGLIEEIKKFHPNTYVYVVPNRGRDVLPFLFIANRLQKLGYKNVLKLHSKKSKHRDDGEDWLDELLNKLLPSKNTVSKITNLLNDGAVVGPADHIVSLQKYMGSNKTHLEKLSIKIVSANDQIKINLDDEYYYFAGTMFWASLSSLKPILDLDLAPEDFDFEDGQIDGTMAHAVERLIGVSVKIKVKTYVSDGISLELLTPRHISTSYKYVQ